MWMGLMEGQAAELSDVLSVAVKGKIGLKA
jgi:hypothetical protein